MENSNLGRLPGVLVAPGRTFESLARRPSWLAALIVLVALSALVSVLAIQRADLDALIATGAAAGSEASAEAFRELAPAAAALSVAFLAPASYALLALVFLLAFRGAGATIDYRRALAVNLHAQLPWCVQALIAVPVILAKGTLSAAELQRGSVVLSNLGALAPEGAGPLVLTLLGSVDLFTIWSLALLAIGFSIVGKVSRWKAAAVVVSLWLLWVGGKVGLVALQGLNG